jgi:FkbM family methyltransferase
MTAFTPDLAVSLHRFEISGIPLQIYDECDSRAAGMVAQELSSDEYSIGALALQPGDCVLDIGGHVGIFSVWLAKRFPGIRIYAYEPHPANRELFRRNIEINGAAGIELHPEAVTGCGRTLELAGNPQNSGGYTAYSKTLIHRSVSGIASMTLDGIFERHEIERCALLKIDSEGAEYEVLNETTVWPRIDHLRGEFHMNALLAGRGYSMQGLRDYCDQRLSPGNVSVKFCGMSE